MRRGAEGLWVGKPYGKAAAYRRDPVAHLSHGATAFQVARFYFMLDRGFSGLLPTSPAR